MKIWNKGTAFEKACQKVAVSLFNDGDIVECMIGDKYFTKGNFYKVTGEGYAGSGDPDDEDDRRNSPIICLTGNDLKEKYPIVKGEISGDPNHFRISAQ